MAEATTIARPYAQAVFKIAKEDGKYQQWADMLELLAAVTSNAQMKAVITDPTISDVKLVELISSVCGKSLDKEGQNLLRVLVENNRLTVVPEISEIYSDLRAEAEATILAEMTSAYDVTDAQRQAVIAVLKKRLGRNVELSCRVDESIIGGAVIRAGDLVIDGSIAGQVERLASELIH